MTLKAPFPWFGGKRRVADVVWRAFGDVPNYVEPFAGSLAVLLGRPHDAKIESVLGKGKNVGGRRPCAVFLDPPYAHELRAAYLYAEDDATISVRVREWALEHGDDPELCIALCGYEGEHEMPASWQVYAWKAARGYAGADNDNRERERIWFSPHCLPLESAQRSLFAEAR